MASLRVVGRWYLRSKLREGKHSVRFGRGQVYCSQAKDWARGSGRARARGKRALGTWHRAVAATGCWWGRSADTAQGAKCMHSGIDSCPVNRYSSKEMIWEKNKKQKH